MFHSITWQQFFATIGIGLLFYYLFLGLSFYRKDIIALISGKKLRNKADETFEKNTVYEEPEMEGFTRDEEEQGIDEDIHETGLFTIAYELAEEIKILLKDAGYRRLIRQELIQALKGLVSRAPYNQLSQTGFRNAINNLIETEAMRQCTYELTAEELSMVWSQ